MATNAVMTMRHATTVHERRKVETWENDVQGEKCAYPHRARGGGEEAAPSHHPYYNYF